MSENNCKDTLAKVFDFLANDLEDADRTQVTSHLGQCDTCKQEYALEIKISELITSSSLNAQATFAAKMQSRLQSEL